MVVNMDRRYPKGADVQTFSDLSNMSRAEVAARYERFWTPEEAAELIKARGNMARMYRAKPQLWPDGIDWPGKRWYRREDWTRDGKYIGPPDGPAMRKSGVTDAEMAALTAPKAAKVSVTEGALSVTKPPVSVTQAPLSVTDSVSSVTPTAPSKSLSVTCARPGCGRAFEPKRSTARFCSDDCRVRAAREARKGKG